MPSHGQNLQRRRARRRLATLRRHRAALEVVMGRLAKVLQASRVSQADESAPQWPQTAADWQAFYEAAPPMLQRRARGKSPR
jgi:hypothetical protein